MSEWARRAANLQSKSFRILAHITGTEYRQYPPPSSTSSFAFSSEPHILLRDKLLMCLRLFLFLPTKCKTQTRRLYRSQGELGGKTGSFIFRWVIVSSQSRNTL